MSDAKKETPGHSSRKFFYQENNKSSNQAQGIGESMQHIGEILKGRTIELLNEKLDTYDALIQQITVLEKVKPDTPCLGATYCDYYSEQTSWQLVKTANQIRRLQAIRNQLRGKPVVQRARIDTKALKDSVDCRVIAANYLQLRQSGKAWTGKCPFHKDRSPSLAVYADGYKCFGCQAKGDCIDMVMKLEKTDFKQSIERIREYA